jgi:HEPN domain-containing protein
MPQYDIAFAEKLSQVAALVLANGIEDLEAQRTVLYLSLLSTEISLKAMLERAGKSGTEIRARSHNLSELLTDLGRCMINVEVSPGQCQAVSASRLRARELKYDNFVVTVGVIIDTDPGETSQYPNQVRYGERLRHYPPDIMVLLAATVVEFAKENWLSLRLQ